MNPDGTLGGGEEMAARGQAQDFTLEQDGGYYCGAGGLASRVFGGARAMGWARIAVYDGGWFEWSQFYK